MTRPVTRPGTRLAASAAAVGAVAALAGCLELSGPADGIASISVLESPSPAVALGDVLRDSTAAPAPLRIVAYDADGKAVAAPDVRFVVLDSGITVDPNGVARGERVRTDVRIVALVGDLQSQPLRLAVVNPPLSARDSVTSSSFPFLVLATASDTLSGFLGLRVAGAGDAAVAGWPVRFRIERSTVVPRTPTAVPVELVNDSRARSTTDTTDGFGLGLRRLRVRPDSMNAERLLAKVVDTVDVEASTVIGVGAAARVHRSSIRILLRPQ